jgi:putative transcriptional regulator
VTVINLLKPLLKERGISVYRLHQLTGLPTNTLYRINNDQNVYPDRHVVERLCIALECQPGDLLVYVPDVVKEEVLP